MSPSDITLQPFDIRSSRPGAYAAYCRFTNLMAQERTPDDPPVPVAELTALMQNLPPVVEVHAWVARAAAPDRIVAAASVQILHLEENRHLAPIQVEVLPEYRRQGIGSRLLRCLMDPITQHHRRLLMAETHARVPAGAAFLQRIGGRPGLSTHINQLDLNRLESALVQDWLNRGRRLSPEFDIGFWDGPYPDEELPAIVGLMQVMDDQPVDELEMEAFRLSADHLRQLEEMLFAAGGGRWTCYVRHRHSRALVGYTEVSWRPSRPDVVQQGATGVFPAYRNRGVGRWLKAAMLQRLREERPEIRFIRTGNADTNAPMLKINRELGFRPYLSQTTWQIEADDVHAYLTARQE